MLRLIRWQVCPGLAHVETRSLQRPSWRETELIYGLRRNTDLSRNYALHLWYRWHDADYSPHSIRVLDSPLGRVFRRVYYGSEALNPFFEHRQERLRLRTPTSNLKPASAHEEARVRRPLPDLRDTSLTRTSGGMLF